MKHLIFLLAVCSFGTLVAQKRDFSTDTTIITHHTGTFNNQSVSYDAIVGMLPVWNKDNEPIASLFYTYYRRADVKDVANRPIVFSFNGGPGSASVWMHIAYTGPVLLNVDYEGYPVQPYGMKTNPHSILDIADIVYIDPVGTGYSRMIKDKEGKDPDRDLFFGVNADIKYLAEWMNTFVSRNNRWNSPKYIIGESYGGTRVMGLAAALQGSQWMYLNGVIMVSPADFEIYSAGGPYASISNIPYFTAAAWYHKMLPDELQTKDLEEILPESEDFAINKALPALAKGGFIGAEEKEKTAEKMAHYTGLTKQAILDQNLDISTFYFWKELLRRKTGQTIGRLDSRYLGFDKKLSGDSPEYFPELSSWLHSFTPPINHYLKNELGFETDLQYVMLGDLSPWDLRDNHVREGLRLAMAENPYLKVLIQSGYYDGAVTYFQAKETMWQIDPSGKMKDRFTYKAYRSGHMMYLRKEDLKQSNDDIRQFIKDSLSKGKSAKY